jgi:Lipocalin-like domain
MLPNRASGPLPALHGSVRVATGVLWLLASPPHQRTESRQSSLEGVWQRVSVTYVGPDTSWTLHHPQPSVYIFTKGYYSMMFVPGEEPRPSFRSDRPSAAERITAFDSFRASSGRYALRGNRLVLRPLVARVPNLMTAGEQGYVYRLRGDSLWLTFEYPWTADTTRTARIRVRLIRLE